MRAAEEARATSGERSREQREGLLVGRRDAAHLEPAVLARERRRTTARSMSRLMSTGTYCAGAAARRPGAEEMARLDRAAGAELDQRRAPASARISPACSASSAASVRVW